MELSEVAYEAEILYRDLAKTDTFPYDYEEWLGVIQSDVDSLPYDQLLRLRRINDRHTFLLHFALAKQNNAGIIEILLKAYPEEAWTENSIGRLPLHVACAKRASIAVVELLVDAYPYAVEALDDNLQVPSSLTNNDKILNVLKRTEDKLAQAKLRKVESGNVRTMS